jgi:parvulin-like peptidyl-prolyl isomerase
MTTLEERTPGEPTATPTPNAAANTDTTKTTTLARVGKRNLSRSEAIKRAHGWTHGQFGAIPEDEQGTILRKVADSWVGQVSMAEEARARKLSTQNQDTSEGLSRLAEAWGEDPEQAMKSAGFSESDLQREIRDAALGECLVRSIFDSRFQGSGLKELYEKTPERFPVTPSLRVREILIPSGSTPESIARSGGQASEITQAARQPDAEFSALAARHSKAPSARNGGDLGWFDHANRPPSELASALAGLKPGDVTDPVRSIDGWRIYQLVDTKVAEPSFDRVKDEVMQTAWQIARESALEASLNRQRGEVILSSSSISSPLPVTVKTEPKPIMTTPSTVNPSEEQRKPERNMASGARQVRRFNQPGPDSGEINPRGTKTPGPEATSPSSLAHVLSRVGGQDQASPPPAKTPQTLVTRTDGMEIRSRVSIRASGQAPRSSGDAVAALPGAMRAAGNQLLERAGLQARPEPNEPPAQSMAFINVGGAGGQTSGGDVANPSSARSIPDLSPTELRDAIEPSSGGPSRPPWSTPPSEKTPGAQAEPIGNSTPQKVPSSQDPGKQIPEGFGKAAERTVVGKAANTMKKPVSAVKGAVDGALGLFRRDRDK